MKKLIYGFGALAVLAAGSAIAVTQIKARAINAFETDFSQLKSGFAKAQHGAVDFDLWNRRMTVSDILLLPANAEDVSATRIAKLTATGVSQSGERITAEHLTLTGFAATMPPMAEMSGRIRYEAPIISVDQFSMRSPPASSGIGTPSWTRQILLGMTAASIALPSLKSVAALPAPPMAAGVAPQQGLSAPLEQVLTNIRLEGLRDGKIAKGSVERARATTRMQPPARGEFLAETQGSFVTDYDITASLALFAPDAAPPQPGFTTVWRTAGSGPVTVKAGDALTMTISGLVADGIAIDMAKFRAAFAVMQASIAKSGASASPTQAQATIAAVADLYESVNVGAFEYKDMLIEGPGVPPTKTSLLRLDSYEKGKLAKFTVRGVDGMAPQGGKFRLDHFAIEGMKLSQMMRLTKDLATPAPAQSTQAGWALIQTVDGIRLEGLIAPSSVAGEPMRIDMLQANWGNFIGSMPTTGAFKLKAQMPLGPTTQGPLATLAALGLRDQSVSLDGKWNWNETTKRLEIGPISSEVGGTASAAISLSVGNVQRAVLDGGPMMLAIALPEFQMGQIAFDVMDLGIIRMLGANAGTAPQVEQGIQMLRSAIETIPPEKADQRAIIEGVMKFLSSPGSRLSIAMSPNGSVTLGSLLAAGQAGPQLMAFVTERMTTKVTVAP